MTSSAAERQARRRAKLRAQGIVQVNVLVPVRYVELVKRFAARLMKRG